MSNAATAAFLSAWRSSQRQPVGLCVIELATPSAATIRVATAECIAGAYAFEAGLDSGVVTDMVDYLDPGPAPVLAQFALHERDYAALSPYGLKRSLSLWRWKGARVRLYRWERSLTDFSDALQVFVGRIDTISPGAGTGVQFTAIQDRANLTARVASVVIDKTNRPSAPDGAIGACVPVLYGDHGSPPLRGVMAGLGFEDDLENVGGGRGAVPLLLTDPGTGAAKVRIEAASHAISDLYNTSGTCRLFMVGDGVLAPVDTAASTITETLAAGGSYADIDDDALIVKFRVVPVDVRVGVGNNSALKPRRAMDIADETSYATLDQTAGQNKLDLMLPNPAPLGKITGTVQLFVLFTGDAANTQNLRVYVRSAGASSGTASTASTSAAGTVLTATYPAGWWSENWEFGRNEGGLTYGGAAVGDTLSVCVDFAGAVANNKARIYAVGAIVPAKPSRDIVTPGTPSKTRVVRADYRGNSPTKSSSAIWQQQVTPAIPDVAQVTADFFATPKGYVDDGSGTYTGSAGAVIERVPDIVRHALVTYGGVAGGDIVTSAGAFGSFVDARSTLRDGNPSDVKLACYIVDKMTVQDVCKKTCEQGLAHMWLDVHDGKWRMKAWKRGDPVDYDLTLEWAHLIDGLRVREGSIVDVKQEVRVGYLFDHYKGRQLAEAFVGETGSSQGWALPTTRDQVLTVTAGVNDKLDYTYVTGAPVTTAETLTAATYAPIDLAGHIQDLVRTRIGGSTAYKFVHFGHGFTVKAGLNDNVEFEYGGTPCAGTLVPARYTADDYVIELARAMNVAAGLIGVIAASYDHSTNKVTITSAGSNVLLYDEVTAADGDSLCWPTAGFRMDALPAAGTSLTGTHAAYSERFWFTGNGVGISFLFATGANLSRSCGPLVGMPQVDTTSATPGFLRWSATYSRSDRETRAAALRTEHGVTGSLSIVADWVRDENTAVSLRNRTWDHVAEPPQEISFSTAYMPDLRRLQTFAVHSEMDARVAFPRYGSDGSWAGKVLRCLGKASHTGPSFHDEITAVEA